MTCVTGPNFCHLSFRTMTVALSLLAAGGAQAQTYTFSTLVNFNGLNGSSPNQGVIVDGKGNIYGTTSYGGAGSDGTMYNGNGTIYELSNTGTSGNPSYSSIPDTLATLNGTTQGTLPSAGVTLDASGNVYTTPIAGGDLSADFGFGGGTVDEISASTNALTTVATFSSTTGFASYSGVTFDSNGNMLIAGSAGGDLTLNGGGGAGTILMIANTGTLAHPVYSATPTVLADFEETNGTTPEGTLRLDSNGDIFGTTARGGDLTQNSGAGDGTVFEIKNTGTLTHPNYSSGITTLVTFEGANGVQPAFTVTLDSKGNLFGTTVSGGDLTLNSGYGYGNVFEIANTGTLANPNYSGGAATIANFEGPNGIGGIGNIAIDGSGNLYGETELGGDSAVNSGYGDGTVFEIANSGTLGKASYSSGINTLFAFNGTDGANPEGNLALDSNGDLIGAGSGGGTNGDGTVFELARNLSGAASAPEPGALALLLPGIGLAFPGIRRRLAVMG